MRYFQRKTTDSEGDDESIITGFVSGGECLHD